MRSALAAVAFLTRLPVGKWIAFDTSDVAKSASWFPLVGILLGGAYSLMAALLQHALPAGVTAVLLVIADAVATGGLHFDGLADTADGFGGGKSSEDVLRIMRDHSIGSYGGLALAAVVALKATAFAALLSRPNWRVALFVTPALGRWTILLLTWRLPYARTTGSVVEGMKTESLVIGTVVLGIALFVAMSPRAWVAALVCALVTGAFGWYCRQRIGGITGDTLGANLQLCESAALLTFLGWTAVP